MPIRTILATLAGMTVEKRLLRTLHSPILYVLGGEPDIAYTTGNQEPGLKAD